MSTMIFVKGWEMPKKLSYSYIKESMLIEGYTLLSEFYGGCSSKIKCLCPDGHEYFTTWDTWKSGRRCPYCSGYRKHPSVIKNSFSKEGYTLLNEYKNARQFLNYICPRGHRHYITWANWQLGHRCPYCNGNNIFDIEFVKDSFGKEGYELLATEYKNAHGKLKFKCDKGHIGYITWANWQLGHRCRKCWQLNICGEGNSFWKGGATPFSKEVRNFIKTTEWSDKVFKRDEYRCQRCGEKGKILNAHHILPVSMLLYKYNIASMEDIKKCGLLFSISNGITLCVDCHKWVHSKENIDKYFMKERI